jgi:hypothetical protein
MGFIRCLRFTIPILSASIALTLPAQQPGAVVSTTIQPPAEAAPPSHGTYPQIVRLSLVQGDVRITRGKQNEKLTGATWEQAAAGIPLETGFNLVTGQGRAEIEFEDASTLYLADNSALSFNELTTRDGVPSTTLTLLTGTITTHLSPTIPGEKYILKTPTGTTIVSYGEKSYIRLTSYLDGIQITPQDSEEIQLDRTTSWAARPGKSIIYTYNGRILQPSSPDTLAEWDKWVADRVNTRTAAMLAVMKEAKLSTPLPGLADLQGQGTFFDCAPYGTCWEPTHGWVPEAAPDSAPKASPEAPEPEPHLQKTSFDPSRPPQLLAQLITPVPQTTAPLPPPPLYVFPCFPESLAYYRLLRTQYNYLKSYPYDWVVCHTGSWLFRNHRYVWVSGTHKHHRCPVRWVKYQNKLAFVPLHPRDEPGKLPVNVRHGLYVLPGKSGGAMERVNFDPKSPPHLVDGTPKEFRNPAVPSLGHANAPELQAQFVHEPSRPGAVAANPIRTSTLTFDHRTQGFALSTRVTQAGHTTTFTEPFSDRGGHLQPPSAGRSFGGGYAGGARGGGYGSSHGGGSAGGH